MTTPLDLVVGKLRAAGCDPVSSGRDSFESRCPVHRGSRRNLSVGVGDDGRVLLHCHHVDSSGTAGCTPEAIVGAIGLRLEDLWPKPNGPATGRKTSGKKSWPELDKAMAAVGYHLKPIRPPESWTYHEPHGAPIMAVARYDILTDGKEDKTYRPFRRLPDGSWATGDPPGLLPLYRLREVSSKSGPIFVVEGEKCVLAVVQVGAVATTSAHGAESPHKTDWSPLAGKPVVILPDADGPGEGYAISVLRQLKRLDPRPPWVRVVRLPGQSEGEDVADWIPRIRGDRTGDDGRRVVQQALQALVDAAPVVDWDAVTDGPPAVSRPAVEAREDADPMSVPDWPAPPDGPAFHGLAGEVVRLIEPSSEADPVGVLLQFLVGFGNAVGPGLSVLADGHYHHANEFVVTVGDTSRARKGTSWRRVQPILAHADPEWADSRITGGLSSGEGLIHEIRDPIEGPDRKGEVGVRDHGVTDKRVLVMESELGNVLRVLARDGNTLSGVLRQAWDGDSLRTMVKTSPARASHPHVSLVGHITAEELDRYLSRVEVFNGLGNRILWACVRRSKRLPFGGSIEAESVLRLGSRLASALDHARGVGLMGWTPSGKAVWESQYDVLTESRPGLLGAITSRAEAHVLRLALIYAALDGANAIGDTHVHAALAVWRFCDRSAAYLFGGSVGDKDSDAILAALRSKPEGMTRSEIRRVVLHDHRTSEEVDRAMGLLLRHALVRREMTDTGGRRAERWYATTSGQAVA